MCTAGSLDQLSDDDLASLDRTYLFPDYEVTCNGTVHSWQYCYLFSASRIIYPSIWRLISPNTYIMIGVNEVTITPGECPIHNISSDQQIPVQTGDIIGLHFVNTGLFQSTNFSMTPYSYMNNQTGTVTMTGRSNSPYNIVIKVFIGKFHVMYNTVISV